jgi:hypothetical protein
MQAGKHEHAYRPRLLKRLSDARLCADQRNLAANAGAQIFTVEAPRAAYFMSSQLARPHEAVKSGATYS